MKALCDAVGFGEAPHADDGFVPVGESSRQADDRCEAAGLEGFDEIEQAGDEFSGLVGGEVLGSHELVGLVHLFVDGLER